MELKPGEFEALITNLFAKIGLETRMPQPSRDGGVDCVAFDNRAIFGGKVIIQAKRDKNPVPASAVRDLAVDPHSAGSCGNYRYWPVLVAVSMARPDSAFLPVTRVRM
ncbi:MAG: restriction endonuclease [Pseudonocardiaceae bacterium]